MNIYDRIGIWGSITILFMISLNHSDKLSDIVVAIGTISALTGELTTLTDQITKNMQELFALIKKIAGIQ